MKEAKFPVVADGKTAVVLFSGGMDSTTILTKAVEIHGEENVIALSLIYGQRHAKELESAKMITSHFGVAHVVKDVSSVFEFASGPLLGQGELPTGTYLQQQKEAGGTVDTYVPFRNGLFISLATAVAYSLKADIVYYGAHADDAAGNAYPDCTPEFYASMEAAIDYGTEQRVKLYAPLQDMTKAEIAAYGHSIGAPFQYSWSCYAGGDIACGECGTCVDRRAAFTINGLVDPAPYSS